MKRLILQKQRDGLKPATVENIKALVSGIFTHAYEDEILTVNPALKLGKFIKREGRRHHVKPLTRELTIHFLRCVREHFPHQYPFMLCAFRTGMRLGELLGLSWADLDFEGNIIEIRRSYSHGRFSTPKSNKARFVDVSNQLRVTLLEHREALRQRFQGQLPVTRLADGSLVQLVFTNATGGPICGDNFRARAFRKMIEVADVPKFRFHDIRHSFASLLLCQGESLHYVKEQMGHASIQTTVDVYGHLVPGSNRNAVNRLDDPDEPGLWVVPASAG